MFKKLYKDIFIKNGKRSDFLRTVLGEKHKKVGNLIYLLTITIQYFFNQIFVNILPSPRDNKPLFLTLIRHEVATTWFLSTTSTRGSDTATLPIADMLNPYTSSHQWILSSLYCRSSIAVTYRVALYTNNLSRGTA